MKAMILAAGYGTRLRPVTWTIPKPLVPLCNRPLIGWAVESFIRAGVGEIIVNLHHLPEALEAWLQSEYAGRVEFRFSFEEEILGTGGGVRRVRQWLENEEDFFLVNGDTVQFPHYEQLREARRAQNALAALTLRHPPEKDRFTPVWFDENRVSGFGKGVGESMMFAGSHCISSRVFRHLPDKEFSGIVDEVYQPLIESKKDTVAAIVDDGLWFDIGNAMRYVSASTLLLDAIVRGEVEPPHNSHVRDGSLLDATSNSSSGTLVRSTVGARSVVNGELRDSSVWNDCIIAGSVLLERCIVGHGVEITRPIELSDAVIVRDDLAVPQDAGYERRDGLVIARI